MVNGNTKLCFIEGMGAVPLFRMKGLHGANKGIPLLLGIREK
jgi:hypothetical protein